MCVHVSLCIHNVCMCVQCMCLYVYTSLCMRVCVCVRVSLCMPVSVCLSLCMCVHVSVSEGVSMCKSQIRNGTGRAWRVLRGASHTPVISQYTLPPPSIDRDCPLGPGRIDASHTWDGRASVSSRLGNYWAGLRLLAEEPTGCQRCSESPPGFQAFLPLSLSPPPPHPLTPCSLTVQREVPHPRPHPHLLAITDFYMFEPSECF